MSVAVYVDCFSGASGDMLLGALLDTGVSVDALRAGLATLPVGGWRLEVERVAQHAVVGTRAKVLLDGQVAQPRRGLAEVEAIVRGGALPAAVRQRACAVFRRLAEAEAAVHGTAPEEVHFHEVGAIDAIVDVVGVVLGLHLLDVDWTRLVSSGLPTGTGWVRAEHGRLPVPGPAVLELLRRANAPTRAAPSDEPGRPAIPPTDEPGRPGTPTGAPSGELTTPTGAALLTTLAAFGPPPAVRVERVGYGFGSRELPWPNAVRLWAGAPRESRLLADSVAQVETHLDDASPEQLGFAMERLLEAGALDVAFVPLQMKKNRPGVLVRVLGRPHDGHRLAELVLEHTSALGARVQIIERLIAARTVEMVNTPWGDVRVKLKHLGARTVASPEYEDCARLARAAGVPLDEVYAAALRASAPR